MASLTEQIRAATQNAELLSKSVTADFMDGIYTVNCLLYLRRDIGGTGEFQTDGSDSCVPDSVP